MVDETADMDQETTTAPAGDTDEVTSTAPTHDADDETLAGGTGALPDGSASACAEVYWPAAVENRAFAFDGEVVEIGPSVSNFDDSSDLDYAGATLEVREWFDGGDSDTITVDVQEPEAANKGGSEDGPAYEVGARLPVSGEPRWGGEPLDARLPGAAVSAALTTARRRTPGERPSPGRAQQAGRPPR